MNNALSDDMLSLCLKRAASQIAAVTPVSIGLARPIARHRARRAHRSVALPVVRKRIPIALAVVVAVALASGTAYAGITLLQSVTQTDPGAAAVYRQNLGESLNLSQTRGGVTLTLERVYADVNRVMFTYQIQPGSSSTFAGFAASSSALVVVDSQGQELQDYDASFQTDPNTNETAGIVVYDVGSVATNVRALSLSVTTPGLRMQTRDGATNVVGPFAFRVTVPVVGGQNLTLDKTVTAGGVALTLDRVVASPSETRIYLRASVALEPAEPYLTAHITGNGYDSRTLVITSPAELIDLGATFRAPNGEAVVTFNNSLFGKRGRFTLTVESIGGGVRIVGPWSFTFVVP